MDVLFSNDAYQNQRVAEAVLFCMGRAVAVSELAKAMGTDAAAAKKAAEALKADYEERGGGLLIREVDGKYQMCTDPGLFPELTRLVSSPPKPVLTDVVMETLAIIACKSPATRLEIEKIRGVKSDFAVNKLLEYELIKELGRLDAPGRPILFRPTDEFYRRFGVSGKEELPKTDASVDARIEDEVRQELKEYDLSAGKEKD